MFIYYTNLLTYTFRIRGLKKIHLLKISLLKQVLPTKRTEIQNQAADAN